MPEINIGRLRGGYCVYWTGSDGRRTRRQLASRNRKEAETEALEVYRTATYSSRPKDPTIADIWAAYIEDLGDKPTATTMKHTGKAVLAELGHLRPADLSRDLCRAYDAARRASGKSQGTVWTELGHLQSALNFHFGRAEAPKIWRPVKPQSDKRILNPGECAKLIDSAHDPHIRLALIMLLGTGARVSAVLDLTWDRVDFERGVINLRLSDAATRKGRAIVPMNGSTRSALQSAEASALSDFVIEYAGRQVRSIRKGVANAVERSGIGHVRIHDLRHTAAVTMLSAGIPIEKVAQVLGHSNISVTYSTYGRYLPEHMQDAVNVLDFATISKRN